MPALLSLCWRATRPLPLSAREGAISSMRSNSSLSRLSSSTTDEELGCTLLVVSFFGDVGIDEGVLEVEEGWLFGKMLLV